MNLRTGKQFYLLFLCMLCVSVSKMSFAEPLYETILEDMKARSDVIPKVPNVHPIHTVYNREAVIPPQCYTKTEGRYNPCYVCHQDAIAGRENVMNDGALQKAYSFSDTGLTNHWKNLFEDRSDRISRISDEQILQWVREDNYSILADRLKQANFKGWIPDLKKLEQADKAFDNEGFALDNSHWVAFNYKPMPSTFWPTNGATDDVMIRLPESFRTNSKGEYSREIYKANLTILEASIKGVSEIDSLPIDEKKIQVDLNQDNKLGVVNRISATHQYVGAAKGIYMEPTLYPEDTEFLHTVRYLDVKADGSIGISTRMKEVRYMRKWRFYNRQLYARKYELESFEKDAGNLPGYQSLGNLGLDNGNGWAIQSFLEDRHGQLRASTYEENFFCMGCHNSIGSTIDKTFSFARKMDGAKGWGYINLKGMPDAPNQGEQQGEIVTYLQRVGGGSEFRNNDEMRARWFNTDGSLNRDALAQARDVYDLITPSKARALELNKAYKVIVDDQDYIFGRDATLKPPQNVYSKVNNESAPTLTDEHIFKWDIRLDWSDTQSRQAGLLP